MAKTWFPANRSAQSSLCHLLNVSSTGVESTPEVAVATDLVIPGPRPLIRTGYEAVSELPADDAIESWTATLERLLRVWV